MFTIFVCLYCKVHTHQNGLKPSSSLCISIGWRAPWHDKLLSFAFTLVAHVVCIAAALDAKTVYLLPLSLIRSPSGGSSRGFACTLCKLPDNHSLQIRSQQSQQIRTQYRGKYSACVSSPRKKTNVYFGTSKVQRQARIARDIGKVPSLKIGLSIFFETTRW